MSITQAKTGVILLKQKKFFSWDVWEPVIKIAFLVLGLTIIVLALERGILFNWDTQKILRLKTV